MASLKQPGRIEMLASNFIERHTGLKSTAKPFHIYLALIGFFCKGGGWDVGNAMIEIFQPTVGEVEDLGEEWERMLLDYDYNRGEEMVEFFLAEFGPKEIQAVEALASAIVALNKWDADLDRKSLKFFVVVGR